MKEFYVFAAEHPIITFLLVAIAGETIVKSLVAICEIMKVWIKR